MKVYLAPGFYKNIKRSVIDGVKISELDIADNLLREGILQRYEGGVVKLWALKETLLPQWKSIEGGDFMLFYHGGRIIYGGRVCFKHPFEEKDEQVKTGSYLAESVWGRDVDGRTWPYLVFLEDVRELNISLPEFNKLTGYNLRYIRKFMRISERRSSRLMEFLENLYTKHTEQPTVTPTPEEELVHDRIVDVIYALGELIGYVPGKEWVHEEYKFDVVWFKPPRFGPKYVFEVHIRGSLEAALLRLKHAYDLWESNIFLVSTESELRRAESKFLGELHELRDRISLVKISDIESFYEFKGRFEWLERKFGLRAG